MKSPLVRVVVALVVFVGVLAVLLHVFKAPPAPVASASPRPKSAELHETLPPSDPIIAPAPDAAAPVAPERAVRTGGPYFVAFQAPGATTGMPLTGSASQLIRASNAGRKLIGRTAPIDRATFADLARHAAGEAIVIPLFGGEKAEGVVNLVRTESNGWVRMGGALTGGREGSFYLAANGREVHGFVQFPKEQIAYELVTEGDGRTQLVERFRGDIVCAPLPRMRDEPEALPAFAGPVAAVPILNSRPSATEILYLDFDGEVVSDPSWNNGNTINAASFNLSNTTITQIFDRVADDWISFNINVTTDLARYESAQVGHRMRCIITPTDTAARGAGGVAYLTSFRNAGSQYSDTIPCWVFNSQVVGISEAISHELGHTMGLKHDGRTSPSEEYFEGHGSGAIGWCPIMGAGYYKNVVQWSKGEDTSANNKEDDLAIISATYNHFGYAADLVGNTRTSASPIKATVGSGAVNQTGVSSSAITTSISSSSRPTAAP